MLCNIDFEKLAETGYQVNHYEMFPATNRKLSDRDSDVYSGAWQMCKQGINEGLMVPQFHGRERMNIKLLEDKLVQKDQVVLTALRNRSYTSKLYDEHLTVSPTAAFDFWEFKENE